MPVALNVATFNANGLNGALKQVEVLSLFRAKRLDVVFVQEHNVREVEGVRAFNRDYEVVFNPSVRQKGGTLVLLRRGSGVSVVSSEMDVEGRVVLVRVSFLGNLLVCLNVYAPSGSAERAAREVFFRNTLLYYLRHDSRLLLWGGG